MIISVAPQAKTGDKLGDVEAFARMLTAINVAEGSEADLASVAAARSIGAELLLILKGKPRLGVSLGSE